MGFPKGPLKVLELEDGTWEVTDQPTGTFLAKDSARDTAITKAQSRLQEIALASESGNQGPAYVRVAGKRVDLSKLPPAKEDERRWLHLKRTPLYRFMGQRIRVRDGKVEWHIRRGLNRTLGGHAPWTDESPLNRYIDAEEAAYQSDNPGARAKAQRHMVLAEAKRRGMPEGAKRLPHGLVGQLAEHYGVTKRRIQQILKNKRP